MEDPPVRRLLLSFIGLALLASACSISLGSKGTGSAAPANPLAQTPLSAGKEPVEAVVRHVLPAVVNVTSNVIEQSQFGGAQQGKGVGTGFVVRSDGVIVTNCHVVEGANKITVSTSAQRPVQYQARVIGGDCEHDLAVLKVSATGLPTVALGDSNALQLGQRVVALGYALALVGGPTVTTGIVSSLNRTIQVQDPSCSTATCGPNQTRTYTGTIQTDAAINHGNSGGPLVNMAGQVVGINSAGVDSAQNIGFAIPIDAAKDTIAKAETSPLAPSAYLGVTTQSVTSNLALQFGLKVNAGAYVVGTTSGGPAQTAGLAQGDVIVSVDGRAVASSDALGSVLTALKPGTSVAVQVVHADGQHETFQITLGTRPEPVQLP